AGKTGYGFELYENFANLTRSRLCGYAGSILFNVSCSKLCDHVEEDSVDLCITSPPYWNVLNQKRSADLKDTRTYGNLPGDFGNTTDYREFLASLELLFSDIYQVLKPGAYCCVVVMDLRKKSEFFPFHSDVADRLQEASFKYDDLIIWDRRADYNN